MLKILKKAFSAVLVTFTSPFLAVIVGVLFLPGCKEDPNLPTAANGCTANEKLNSAGSACEACPTGYYAFAGAASCSALSSSYSGICKKYFNPDDGALTDEQRYLYAHNYYRCRHWENPDRYFSTSSTLTSGSQSWANDCGLEHSDPDSQYGENLAYSTSTTWSVESAIGAWLKNNLENMSGI